jgi:hypothetical protein
LSEEGSRSYVATERITGHTDGEQGAYFEIELA